MERILPLFCHYYKYQGIDAMGNGSMFKSHDDNKICSKNRVGVATIRFDNMMHLC